MGQTADEVEECARWRAVETVAWLVMMLAEERHEAQKHEGAFEKCAELLCMKARDAYYKL